RKRQRTAAVQDAVAPNPPRVIRQSANLSPNPCQERGQPCPRERKSRNPRTRLSLSLLSAVAAKTACLLGVKRTAATLPDVQPISNKRGNGLGVARRNSARLVGESRGVGATARLLRRPQ